LDSLDEKRKALEASISVGQLEAGVGKLQASDSEAARMTDLRVQLMIRKPEWHESLLITRLNNP
jgi:hypothetical protein